MLVRRRRALPLTVIRDLLGLARALYRAEHAKLEPDAGVLESLKTIGEHLNLALDLGRSPPDTMGSRAAWGWAERAATALAALVDHYDLPIAVLVRTSLQRLER